MKLLGTSFFLNNNIVYMITEKHLNTGWNEKLWICKKFLRSKLLIQKPEFTTFDDQMCIIFVHVGV